MARKQLQHSRLVRLKVVHIQRLSRWLSLLRLVLTSSMNKWFRMIRFKTFSRNNQSHYNDIKKFLSDKLEGTFFIPFLLMLKISYIFVQ